jgi:hypothetical protein
LEFSTEIRDIPKIRNETSESITIETTKQFDDQREALSTWIQKLQTEQRDPLQDNDITERSSKPGLADLAGIGEAVGREKGCQA